MNPKIVLCKSSLLGPVSGADEIMLNYAVHLRQAGYDAGVVLLYAPNEDDQYYQRLRRDEVPVKIIVTKSVLFATLRALRNLFSSLLFFLFLLRRTPDGLRRIWQIALRLIAHLHYRECRAYFAKSRPDVMHVFTPDSGAAMLIRAGHELKIPVLYHEMGTAHHMPMLEDHYRRLENVLPLCTEFAALSPRLASEWSARFPFLKSISVLPLIMRRAEAFDLGLAESLRTEQTVFGFAARLEEGKGPLVLLDALARVNATQPLAMIRIAGTGLQVAEVKARVRELGLRDNCEFVGQYSEPLGRTAFMESLDAFVLPSFAEGTPNSVIEAMAHGLPVIASAVGGVPDIVDPECGVLVPAGDARALAEAMLLLVRNPDLRKRMGLAARARYEKLFEPAAVLPVLLKTYNRIAGNGHFASALAGSNGHAHPWTEAPALKSIANDHFDLREPIFHSENSFR
ncbi:MAG TPA: glycosyltransferase [Pyrinomonadaceae bacterium]|jgi:glycosyltransferase involved in cell wall biosynthesis|nr:glycosyltransferase [Pyrinomonadaceae bacterium]